MSTPMATPSASAETFSISKCFEPCSSACIKTTLITGIIVSVAIAVIGGLSFYSKFCVVGSPGNWVMAIGGSISLVGFTAGLIASVRKDQNDQKEKDSVVSTPFAVKKEEVPFGEREVKEVPEDLFFTTVAAISDWKEKIISAFQELNIQAISTSIEDKCRPISTDVLVSFLLKVGVLTEKESEKTGLSFERMPEWTHPDPKSPDRRVPYANKFLRGADGWESALKKEVFTEAQIGKYSRYVNTSVSKGAAFPIRDESYKESREKETGQPFYMNAVGHVFGMQAQTIITHGPTQCGMSDFWQLVWETDAQYVLNLTGFIENRKIKCDEYFPHRNFKKDEVDEKLRKELISGEFTITLVEEPDVITCGAACPVYRLSIRKGAAENQVEKHVTLIHAEAWQDNTDHSVKDVFPFVKLVADNSKDAPIIAHCSAGVGRSGTFSGMLMTYQIIEYALKNSKHYQINFKNLLCLLRSPPFEREGTIQTGEQYLMLEDFAAYCMKQMKPSEKEEEIKI